MDEQNVEFERFDLLGMTTAITHKDNITAVVVEFEREGLKLASISNTAPKSKGFSLPDNRVRLTFLPAEAFTGGNHGNF